MIGRSPNSSQVTCGVSRAHDDGLPERVSGPKDARGEESTLSEGRPRSMSLIAGGANACACLSAMTRSIEKYAMYPLCFLPQKKRRKTRALGYFYSPRPMRTGVALVVICITLSPSELVIGVAVFVLLRLHRTTSSVSVHLERRMHALVLHQHTGSGVLFGY